MELLKHEIIIVGIALAFNGLDFLTGVVKALKSEEKLNSTKMRDGFFKKCGFIFTYVLAMMLNHSKDYFGFSLPVDLVPIVCGWAVLTEVISIIENICQINTDFVPSVLKKLIGLKDEEVTE